MSADFNENTIEFIEHGKTAFVTFTEKKFINRIKRIAKKNPECVILDEQTDSIYAMIPTSWVKIQPAARLSDEQRQMYRERMNGIVQKQRASSDKFESKTDSNIKKV